MTPAGTLLDSEVMRLQGQWVLASGGPPTEALEHWHAGLALARSHHATWYALRNATEICRAMTGQGQGAAGRALLAEVMNELVPSAQCPDQQQARQLLAD